MRTWSSMACRLMGAGGPGAVRRGRTGGRYRSAGEGCATQRCAGQRVITAGGVQEWTAATLNRPLTTGDRLWSDAYSRAELDLGAAVMRLGGMTGFSFLNLDDSSAQIQLTAGTLIVRVRDMREGDNYEIDTPNLAVTLQQPGEYRFEVNEAGDATVVKVSEGFARPQLADSCCRSGLSNVLPLRARPRRRRPGAPRGS